MRPGLDLGIYLVTDTVQCGSRGVPAVVAAAVAGGVGVVQLRDPKASDDEFCRLGWALREVLDGTGVPLIVDDRVQLVNRIGAAGVHVGQRDMPVAAARELLGAEAIIGLSVSTLDQVRAVRAARPGTIDYLGAGPVWATDTKPDHDPPIGPAGLGEIVAASPWPVVAIGGIGAPQIAELRSCGIAGIAVVSAICAAEDPSAAAAALRTSWEDNR